VLYSSKTLTTAAPAFRSAVISTLAALPRGKVRSYATYWSTRSPKFVSATGRQTYAVLELAGSGDTARQDSYDAIKTQLSAPGLRSQVGGAVPTDETIDQQTTASITRAEGLSFPVLLILLLVIFGSLTAACLPLAIGALGILGSFTVLRLLTIVTGVSVFSLNITTILGLGLGIDYGLFLVTRFREELHKQGSVEDAVARTVATAGRTVLVSGVTVAIVLASLMLFPETILRSIGYGGVATVVVDMIAALTVLPALLAVLGPKVNSLRIRRSVQRPPAAENSGGWYRLAHSVMRRPVLYAVPIVVLLLGLGSPFLKVVWGGVDATVLPASAAPRIVTDALNTDFPGNPTSPIEAIVAFRGPVASSPARTAGLASYASRLDHVPGITAAQVTGVRGGVARIDLSYGPGPYTPQARAIVGHVRGVAAPPRRHRADRRADRRARRRALQHRPHPAVDGPGRGHRHVPAAVPRVRVTGPAAGGDRGEHPLAVGDVRGGDVDLPGRAPVRAAGLHSERDDQPDYRHPRGRRSRARRSRGTRTRACPYLATPARATIPPDPARRQAADLHGRNTEMNATDPVHRASVKRTGAAAGRARAVRGGGAAGGSAGRRQAGGWSSGPGRWPGSGAVSGSIAAYGWTASASSVRTR
jgi:uncharacterized membrane protein